MGFSANAFHGTWRLILRRRISWDLVIAFLAGIKIRDAESKRNGSGNRLISPNHYNFGARDSTQPCIFVGMEDVIDTFKSDQIKSATYSSVAHRYTHDLGGVADLREPHISVGDCCSIGPEHLHRDCATGELRGKPKNEIPNLPPVSDNYDSSLGPQSG